MTSIRLKTQPLLWRSMVSVLLGITAWLVCASALADESQQVFELGKRQAKEGPEYRFDVVIESGEEVASGAVDPSAPAGQRLVLKSPAESSWSDDFKEELNEFDENVQEVLWCQSLLDDAAGFKTVTRKGESYVYELDLAVNAKEKEEVKFARNVTSEVELSVTDGAVLRYRLHAPKPFRPVMVAKIQRFEVTIECDRSPDGRTYSKEMRADIEGKAMMKSFKETQRRSISNLMALP